MALDLVSCQLLNDGVYEPEQICSSVKPVETLQLGVSTQRRRKAAIMSEGYYIDINNVL